MEVIGHLCIVKVLLLFLENSADVYSFRLVFHCLQELLLVTEFRFSIWVNFFRFNFMINFGLEIFVIF